MASPAPISAIAINHRDAYTAGLMLTGPQIRAARALLGWTIQRLASESGIHFATLSRAEQHDGVPPMRTASLSAIQSALEGGGVVFLEPGALRDGGAGVRLR